MDALKRTVLFRGKQVDNGEWVYGYLYQDGLIGCNIFQTKPHLAAYIVDPYTVCQYTGLTDKNGVKIFEGDILKWDEKEWGCPFFETVTWNYELFGIRQREWKNFCEVIGNIFDNPELLGENNT